MANHTEWPCCREFFSLCINPGTKQHLSGSTISSYRDLFTERIKYIFQQKSSQLHSVLARTLLLFPAFYLLPQHIPLPRHLWGAELSLRGRLTCHPAVALALRPPTHHLFYTVGKHSLHLGCPEARIGKDLCLRSGGDSRAQASQCSCSTCPSHRPVRHRWVTSRPQVAICHSVSI